MHQDSFLYNSRKTIPRSVERGFWGRVRQPFCCLFPGMFFCSASIKHYEAWNHALSHFECSQSRKKSTCFLHGCKGNRRQELHLLLPRKAKVCRDLLDICKNGVGAQLHPGEILSLSLSSFSSPFPQSLFFSIIFLLSKSLLFKDHSYTCASSFPPPPYFSYLICSEVNPVASPVFQLFSAFHAASL